MAKRLVVLALIALVASGSILTPAASAAPAAQPGGIWHVVRWGDTLWRISRQYGVTISAIVAANGLANSNRIYPGQRLLIPTSTTPTCGYQIHTVQRGDTLYALSRRYGVPVWTLARANQLSSPNQIHVGQRLIITKTGISINTPAAGAVIKGSVHVSGVGSGFENTLAVEVQDANGNVLVRKGAIVNADVGQVGPYAVDLTFTPPATTQAGRIVVWRENAADGSVADRTCVSVTLQGSN